MYLHLVDHRAHALYQIAVGVDKIVASELAELNHPVGIEIRDTDGFEFALLVQFLCQLKRPSSILH